MYESHFGFTGSPFQLNPDPAFYFGSQGHSNVMSYLRFGVHQGEGFIVVTGDIGAGKTTLVRTLLEQLNSDEVVAAQVLNTQLQSGELLQSILTAFGVPVPSGSKAQLLAELEKFLCEVAVSRRRALLIVDEAQNLGPEAIEELRMLSNFQVGNHALLQSFLVGQPELRKQLESRSMEQLRQRVIASCHLGPLTAPETRDYIEHRLRHVGWDANPAFDDGVFDVIFRQTGGIPRKINLLCNRLLLSAYLGDITQITPQLADATARELSRETGSPLPAPAAPEAAAAAPSRQDAGVASTAAAALLQPQAGLATPIQRVSRAHANAAAPAHPLVCIADSPLEYLKFATLAQAMQAAGASPPIVLANPGTVASLQADQLPQDLISTVALEMHLGVDQGPVGDRIAAVTLRFGELLDELAPCAVLSSGSGDAVLPCVYLASKRGIPVARLGAGQRRDMQTLSCDLNAVLIDRMSEVLYTPMLKTHYTLYREGIASDRMVCIGNLLTDGLRHTLSGMQPVSEILKAMGLSRDQMRRALRGFVFVSAQVDERDLTVADLPKVARVARDLGKETLVVWPVTETTAQAIAAGKADALLQRSGVVLIPATGYGAELGLIRGATCLITGPAWALVEEADCLDIPSIVLYPGGEVPTGAPGGVIAKIPCDSVSCIRALHEILERGRADDEVVDDTSGAAAARLIDHLRRWLPSPAPAGQARSSSTGLTAR
ncbi:MAG: AAA family ATPase [Ideonella sp.]|nr:AAA family ATPase [Ideonella sp.]MCC7455543.1 AAA family ATPase [Nitrospira sp.]